MVTVGHSLLFWTSQGLSLPHHQRWLRWPTSGVGSNDHMMATSKDLDATGCNWWSCSLKRGRANSHQPHIFKRIKTLLRHIKPHENTLTLWNVTGYLSTCAALGSRCFGRGFEYHLGRTRRNDIAVGHAMGLCHYHGSRLLHQGWNVDWWVVEPWAICWKIR